MGRYVAFLRGINLDRGSGALLKGIEAIAGPDTRRTLGTIEQIAAKAPRRLTRSWRGSAKPSS